jgi:hypothetical protein
MADHLSGMQTQDLMNMLNDHADEKGQAIAGSALSPNHFILLSNRAYSSFLHYIT